MTTCRTVAEVIAAANRDAQNLPPLSQSQADYVAAVLAPYVNAARAA